MNHYPVIESIWFTPPNLWNLNIGFVAIRSGPDKDKWKVYCGFGTGASQDKDEQGIARQGSKVSKEHAVALFPNLDPEAWVS